MAADTQDDTCLFGLGLDLATLLLEWSWVTRRVEHISFYDDVAYRRTVRVDFEASRLPSVTLRGESYRAVPLTLLSKSTITNLDYCDGDGAAAAVLTAREESVVATGVLAGAALTVLRSELLPLALTSTQIRKFQELADPNFFLPSAADEETSGQATRALLLADGDPVLAKLAGARRFLLLARALAVSLPAVVLLAPDTSARTTVTFSHDAYVPRTRSIDISDAALYRLRVPLLEAGLRSLGLLPHRFWFLAPSVGRGGTFHLVVEVPLGLKVTVEALLRFKPARAHRQERLGTNYITGTAHRARLYATGVSPGTLGVATVGIRARVRTTIFPAAVMSIGSLIVLGVGVTVLARSHGTLDVDAAAVLVPLVPTIAAGYIARGSEEHQLTSKIVWGVRVLAITVGLCTFAAAGVLAVSDHRTTDLITWATCLGVAAVAALLLGISAVTTQLTFETRTRHAVPGSAVRSPTDADPGRGESRWNHLRWLNWPADRAPGSEKLRSLLSRI